MKYILLGGTSMSGAILFGGWCSHAEMASIVSSKYPGVPIESAGFVHLSEAPPEKFPLHYVAHVYGGSQSLGLRSRPEDAAIIARSLECIGG